MHIPSSYIWPLLCSHQCCVQSVPQMEHTARRTDTPTLHSRSRPPSMAAMVSSLPLSRGI